MSPLDRAVSLSEKHTVAMRVEQDLSFDVARSGEVLLDVDLGASEVGVSLAFGPFEGGVDVILAIDHPQSLAATAMGGLDRDRETVFLCQGGDFVDALQRLGWCRERSALRLPRRFAWR